MNGLLQKEIEHYDENGNEIDGMIALAEMRTDGIRVGD